MENKLKTLKDTIADLSAYVSSYSDEDELPRIEIDILMQKTRDLYEQLHQYTNGGVSIKNEESKKDVEVEYIQSSMNFPSEEESMESAPAEEQKSEPIIVVEEFESKISAEKPADIYVSKPSNDLGSRLGKKPISDIKSAISLNDNFVYRHQLFGNNPELYEQSLNDLNSAESFDAALNYVKEHFDWDFERPIVQAFLQIVERRFL